MGLENSVHPGRRASLNEDSQLSIYSVAMELEEDGMKWRLSIPSNFKISDANGLISHGSRDSKNLVRILKFGIWPSTIGRFLWL